MPIPKASAIKAELTDDLKSRQDRFAREIGPARAKWASNKAATKAKFTAEAGKSITARKRDGYVWVMDCAPSFSSSDKLNPNLDAEYVARREMIMAAANEWAAGMRKKGYKVEVREPNSISAAEGRFLFSGFSIHWAV